MLSRDVDASEAVGLGIRFDEGLFPLGSGAGNSVLHAEDAVEGAEEAVERTEEEDLRKLIRSLPDFVANNRL